MPVSFIQTLWINTWKDIRIWWRQRRNILAALVMPLTYVGVAWLGAAAVSTNPVALVVEDRGPAAAQMAQAVQKSDVFRVSLVDAETASRLYDQLAVAAIITIPPGFSQRVQAHERAPILMMVNNLNLDLTDDIRRAVPDAITVYYEQQGPTSPIRVTVAQHNLRAADVQLFEFSIVPMISLLITVSALIASGLSTAREWEERSIKELLLSPAHPEAIIAGKVLAGFLSTFLLGLVLFGLGYGLGWTRPRGLYVLDAVFAIALVSLFAAGLGIAIGMLLKRVQSALALSTTFSVWLFFLSGGLGVLQFEPDWLRRIAAFDPLSYGTHALQMAIFYDSTDLLGRDVAVLIGVALAAVGVGALALRRAL
jgi:ABC-2 type transport system permease protein